MSAELDPPQPDFGPPDNSPEAVARRLARLEVRDSSIQGRGVFALEAYEASEAVAEYRGEKVDNDEGRRRMEQGNPYIFRLDADTFLDGDIPNNPAKYLNHSCDPNCVSSTINHEVWLITKRAIQPGEELTSDYGYELTDVGLPPCHCGAPNCFRFMLAATRRWPMPSSLES